MEPAPRPKRRLWVTLACGFTSMGYTHFWTYASAGRDIPARALAIIKPLLDAAYRDGLIQREYDDSRPPSVTPREICFNGVGAVGHDTFAFRVDGVDPFGCCKTARKPYDRVVMQVLLVLAYHLVGFEVSSDGCFGHEWTDVLTWFNREVGRAGFVQKLSFGAPGSDEA